MRSSTWQVPPFKLLLYLEWILLGIAIISSISPTAVRLRGILPSRGLIAHHPVFVVMMSLASLICILLLGAMGYRLPLGGGPVSVIFSRREGESDRFHQDRELNPGGAEGRNQLYQPPLGLAQLYIVVGFFLSWLALVFGGRGAILFPPLLLIVVTRGCLLFPRRGRWLVAGGALASFVMMQYLALLRVKPFGIPLNRLPRLPGARRLSDELIQSLQLNAMVNVTLLFTLVLGFVLLLVEALLQESQSRQQLAEANQRLRRYSLQIEDQATLQERSRIAREIHDTVGHCLTAQSIQLENVALQLATDAGSRNDSANLHQAGENLEQARRLGREALQNVRQAVARLRIHPLQGQRLEEAIAKLLKEFQNHSSIALSSSIDLQRSPSQDLAIVAYRIVQEGLTNITKHSDATTAHLEIFQDLQGLHLRLSDNGNGFDLTQNTTGFGLQSMAERAAAVQGHFRLMSTVGQGCQLELDLPL